MHQLSEAAVHSIQQDATTQFALFFGSGLMAENTTNGAESAARPMSA